MAPVSLFDELTIEKISTPGIHFSCSDPTIGAEENNLVVRAARLFFETTATTAAIRISLEKNIPHGAGLGGGSSDAATTLLGLNEIFATNLSPETLADMASQLGADVPFFIFECAANCFGRGEVVTPTQLGRSLRLLLIKPAFPAATAAAYELWQNSKALPGIDYSPQKVSGLKLFNDLERSVFEKFVFLANLKMWLKGQPEVEAALLSGSGSTVYACLTSNGNAESLMQRLRTEQDPDLWLKVCQTL